jgi:protein TonB
MRSQGPKPTFDPRSPVQPGRSPTAYFIAAVVAAIAIWAFQQRAIENPNREPKRTQQPTKGDLRALFSADDYPVEAQQNGEEGTVQARLDVDSKGRVAGCLIVRTSGHKSLDQVTCDVLRKRARFVPARDASGHAVTDSVVTPLVVWRLED